MLCVKAPNSELPPKAGTGMFAGTVHLRPAVRPYAVTSASVSVPRLLHAVGRHITLSSGKQYIKELPCRGSSPKESQHWHDGVLVKPV